MFKYIAGRNYKQAIHVGNSYFKKGVKPIINYAIESHNNSNEIYNEYNNLIRNINNSNFSIALKLSSVNFDKHITNDIIELCKEKNMKLYIDAENNFNHKKYHEIANELIFNHNHNKSIIHKTYQMYRKDALSMMNNDLLLCKKYSINFCCKLVRGAYWNSEYKQGHLFINKYDTDKSYNNGIWNLYNSNYKNNMSILLATHNKTSIEIGTLLNDSNLFEFAHLQGMNEKYYKNIIENNNINVYIPYGPYNKMIPYLLRRLYENVDMLKYA